MEYHIQLEIDGEPVGQGKGGSKKAAEQMAAKEAAQKVLLVNE
jgi:dsRNA-specific ribonuclease